MANVTASMVKDLRERTGVGMMDCKVALAENDGDMEAAVDWLRAKGISKAAKKSGRIAAEGVIGIALSALEGAVVEVNSETDFVSRNEVFQEFTRKVSSLALGCEGEVDGLLALPFPGGSGSVSDHIQVLVGSIGENIVVRRFSRICVQEGVVAGYVHAPVAPELGRMGVIVGLESAADRQDLLQLGEQIAMHIAAAAPLAVRVEDLDPAVLERERSIYLEQARESGKPAEIAEKMVEGRIRKFCEESVLLSQVFVMDGESVVRKVLEDFEARVKHPVQVKGFERFVLGEGIEKQESDFAAEVAAAVGT